MQYAGVESSESRAAGRWVQDAFGGAYAREVPRKALRALADFPKDTRNTYFLSRGMIKPPISLQRQIFPKVEEYQQKFRDKIIPSEVTAIAFLNLLEWLRIVFLQDAVFLKETNPDLQVWDALPLFK